MLCPRAKPRPTVSVARGRSPMIAAQNLTNSHITLAVKTAVTAVLSIYAANLLHLPQGYWGAMSAIVVMQSEVGATVSASRDRLIGTAIACLTLLGGP